jgi:hypothetical protein
MTLVTAPTARKGLRAMADRKGLVTVPGLGLRLMPPSGQWPWWLRNGMNWQLKVMMTRLSSDMQSIKSLSIWYEHRASFECPGFAVSWKDQCRF